MTDHPESPRLPGPPASFGGPTPPMTPPIAAEGGWGMPPANSPGNPPPPPLRPADAVGAGDHGSKGGIGMLLVGLALVVVSLVVGGVMLALAAAQQQTAIEDLARAPVGCLTELDFTETGTFYVYAETRGEIGDLDGTCSNADRDYFFDEAPRVTLVLTDDDDEILDLERTSGIDYDSGAFAGTAVRTIEIEDEGSYILRVESRENDAVVAIGRDVSEVGTGLGAVGLIVAVLGVLVGVALVVLALVRRRRRGGPQSTVATPGGAGVWAPSPGTTPAVTPPSTTPPAPATWGTPPHTSAPPTVPPPPVADDSFWRPPPPPTGV